MRPEAASAPRVLAELEERIPALQRIPTPFDIPQASLPPAALLPACRHLKEIGFFLWDLGGVDYLPRQPRFEVVYHFLRLPAARLEKAAGRAAVAQAASSEPGQPGQQGAGGTPGSAGQAPQPPTAPERLRLRVPVPGETPEVDSLAALWPMAAAAEREVYDLFGIQFRGHPGLHRILMPDDWQGHPLRKDYPLRGPREATGEGSAWTTGGPRAGDPVLPGEIPAPPASPGHRQHGFTGSGREGDER